MLTPPSGFAPLQCLAHDAELLETIRSENLNVYRASPQRLREDVGQESQIAQDYRGRLVYELLQNADDAMGAVGGPSCIRFELTDDTLWVANSGRALDEADVRGLCGISASKKALRGEGRRAAIGHKGMGFKSVLEITDAPEVFSTNLCFRFSPDAALQAVRPLVDEGKVERVTRAPSTRFPWPARGETTDWERLRMRGMNTAFRFPLPERLTSEQRARLAAVLRELPISALVFLKHIGRVEVDLRTRSETRAFAWTVRRQRAEGTTWVDVGGFEGSGDYRVTLLPDEGEAERFLLAHAADIPIAGHRGGLDEFTWDGVDLTEVSVAARMVGDQPTALRPEWRRIHVFLPTGEPCPYDLLVSGAFGSNLSRQEIRVEADSTNYNGFLFAQAARVLRDRLVPRLLDGGASVASFLRLLDRRVEPGSHGPTPAAHTFYTAVSEALSDLPFLSGNADSFLTIKACAVPPLIPEDRVGRRFRVLLPPLSRYGDRALPCDELCGSALGRVLVDHGAEPIGPEAAAALLTTADPSRSELDVHPNGKVFVDPVLDVLEHLWRGLGGADKARLTAAARREPLFPVGVDGGTARRISTQGSTCFYPPRFLHGEVPLDGLCFLLQDLCWSELTPKERNQVLERQMEAWKALFDIREFKFPEVMRASVLPALDLDRDAGDDVARATLRNLGRVAAVCQLAGRTPNANAPLPYERLGTNRALFNLSRLDVPCRGASDAEIKWVPAYKAYFGVDWLGAGSVETLLQVGRELRLPDLPQVDFVLGPDRFAGLLERFRHLKEAEADTGEADVGEDEVSLDEDEEASLDADDREQWRRFFLWIGVNASLRPVHFHDVEDRASGWLKTANLRRPEGWAFQNVPGGLWKEFQATVRAALPERSPRSASDGVPYFYELHDLEYLVAFSNLAVAEPSARFARALYEHLARHWATLEKVSRTVVALVPAGQEPARRTKPPRARGDELADAGVNLWLFRLQRAAVCPTGHGPRAASRTWLPTPEVQRRFGRRGRAGGFLLPTLDVDAAVAKGKARAFATVLGVRDELGPATFGIEDARVLLDRLCALYEARCDLGADLRLELREVIRPAYRNLLELLSGRAEEGDRTAALARSPVLASDGGGRLRFVEAREVFYLDRRDTRERIETEAPVWTFVIESSPAARVTATQLFSMRVLEESLTWSPMPGDPSLADDQLRVFRDGLRRLAPFVLARIGAERTDERLSRQDARTLRTFIETVEPVTALDLGCQLDGKAVSVGDGSRDAFVNLGEHPQAFVVWGENPWPPDQREAEALAGALCDVLGAGYFESFLALLQSERAEHRLRILRRAGAPLDVDDKRLLFLFPGDGDGDLEEASATGADVGDETRTAAAAGGTPEVPVTAPKKEGDGSSGSSRPRVPLYDASRLSIDGVPVILTGQPRDPDRDGEPERVGSGHGTGGRFGGDTDLRELDALGMWVALTFESARLRRAGLTEAPVFVGGSAEDPDALVFDVSTPERVERARRVSKRFATALERLHEQHGVVPDWPGFDILSLVPRLPETVDRMIELKSSGVASRVQEMTWNEWKTATTSALRERFYLYLVGNLRADLTAAKPYIRTIRNPFQQMAADVQVSRSLQRKVQLAVHQFREAEHLDLSVRDPNRTDGC